MPEVSDRFIPSVPTSEQQGVIDNIRQQYIGLAEGISHLLDDSREKSLALTALEESCMWAIKAVFND